MCEVINNVECPGVSNGDVYLCKMENGAGGARLLVSKDSKEEGRDWAPSARRHAREVWACPSPQTFKAREEVSNVSKSESGTDSPVAEFIFNCSLPIFGDLKAPVASSLGPKPGCCSRRWVRLQVLSASSPP